GHGNVGIEHTEEVSPGNLECSVVIGRKASWARVSDFFYGKRKGVGIERQRFLDVEREDDFDSFRLVHAQVIEKSRSELGVAVAHDRNRYEVRNLIPHRLATQPDAEEQRQVAHQARHEDAVAEENASSADPISAG